MKRADEASVELGRLPPRCGLELDALELPLMEFQLVCRSPFPTLEARAGVLQACAKVQQSGAAGDGRTEFQGKPIRELGCLRLTRSRTAFDCDIKTASTRSSQSSASRTPHPAPESPTSQAYTNVHLVGQVSHHIRGDPSRWSGRPPRPHLARRRAQADLGQPERPRWLR